MSDTLVFFILVILGFYNIYLGFSPLDKMSILNFAIALYLFNEARKCFEK